MAESELPKTQGAVPSPEAFSKTFQLLTGNTPFPWQEKLFEEFLEGQDKIPASCNLPTGLGKTNVIAIWLIALAQTKGKLPRRLVYVVNRRTVVDQTTAEVERIRSRVKTAGIGDVLRRVCGLEDNEPPLAISTLRGQFADNREWSANPARPAVICGTVDMIGSRLLFSGYGLGFKSRPLYAGFLGQDALLVHDEAHLEPAFQELIETIQQEQARCCDLRPLRVMELTATTRNENGQTGTATFTLDKSDRDHPVVKKRIEAPKHLHLKQAGDDAKIAEEIANLALERRCVKDENGNARDADAAVLIFVRTPDEVKKVCDKLTSKKDGVPKEQVQQLTGTMRGLERDHMADPRRPDASRVFARFLKPPKPEDEQWKTVPMPGTVYLVCTSAGEVGVDISADHLVCDLSTFESMIQRFGRVNRFGKRNDTRIEVVYPGKFDSKDKLRAPREATLQLLQELDGGASPEALGHLRQRTDLPCKIEDAFSPKPTILPATDILFDAWALTSIREPMPGRPPVEPYLHGIAEWEPPQTYVAWRQEVEIINTDELLEQYPPADLLDDYPLKPHELLRDRSDRVFKHLESLAKGYADKNAWTLDNRGAIEVTALRKLVETLGRLSTKERDKRLNGYTILLPPSVGGLKGGVLDDSSKEADDVADIDPSEPGGRIRIWFDGQEDVNKTRDMRRVRSIELPLSQDDDAEPRRWEWYESIPLEGGRTARKRVRLVTHTGDVERNARRIVAALSLPKNIADAVIFAARLHDLGKDREGFQIMLGNRDYPHLVLAKSGRNGARLPEPFRHEFASVFDAQADAEFEKLDDEMQDLLLHLIAAHHGRARPHFDPDEVFDPERLSSDADELAMETPRRFARLQRKYGRWGLAYLESLLRAADWAASAEPSAYADETEDKP